MEFLLVTGVVTDSAGQRSEPFVVEFTELDDLPPVDQVLTGSIGTVTVPPGQHYRLQGIVNLGGNLVNNGLVSAGPGTVINGNGFELHAGGDVEDGYLGRWWFDGGDQDGPMWAPADGTASPWDEGRPLLVAPYQPNQFNYFQLTSGDNLPNLRYNIPGGNRPTEVVRDFCTGVIVRNVSRMMTHVHGYDTVGQVAPEIEGGPFPDVLVNVRFEDCGTASTTLGFYPVHYHRIGSNKSGTLIKDCMVLRGRNHAFVVHASHDFTLDGCVAVDCAGDSFWWDVTDGADGQPDQSSISNNVAYVRCGVLNQRPSPLGSGAEPREISAFLASGGFGNINLNSWVAGAQLSGVANASAAHWPGKNNGVPDTWIWNDFVAHNNRAHGIFIWQNHTGTAVSNPHNIVRAILAQNSGAAVEWGAYNISSENYKFIDGILDGDVAMHFNGVNTGSQDRSLVDNCFVRRVTMPRHNADGRYESATVLPSWEYRDCEIADGIFINETAPPGGAGGDENRGTGRFTRCTRGSGPLEPSDFTIQRITSESRYVVVNADGSNFIIGDQP